MGSTPIIAEWSDATGDVLAHRAVDVSDALVSAGMHVIVRAHQEAVFTASGRARDRLGPGRHVLGPGDLPRCRAALGAPRRTSGPLACSLHFVHVAPVLDRAWTSVEPVIHIDRELGPLQLRLSGRVGFRVVEPDTLLRTLTDSRGSLRSEDLSRSIARASAAAFERILSDDPPELVDLRAATRLHAESIRAIVAREFTAQGIALSSFEVDDLELPSHVESLLEERHRLGLLPEGPTALDLASGRWAGERLVAADVGVRGTVD